MFELLSRGGLISLLQDLPQVVFDYLSGHGGIPKLLILDHNTAHFFTR
jgi:hypothetical protein